MVGMVAGMALNRDGETSISGCLMKGEDAFICAMEKDQFMITCERKAPVL